MKYPKDALINRVEGVVVLSAEVTGQGEIRNIAVEHGIGYGCDEEAVRLLSLLKYGKVKNRGVRVTAIRKFRIEFRLPKAKN